MPSRLKVWLDAHYERADMPSLAAQTQDWSDTKPLEGLRILDATPVFRNTTAKYVPLLVAGADVTACVSDQVPFDPRVAAKLPNLGINVANLADIDETYDVIMDCAGYCADIRSTYGYVELTKSGAARHLNSVAPVAMVDSGRIKRIETEFGTGDGFVRAMIQLGHDQFPGKDFLIFGGGKVGAGIARELGRRGVHVSIVDRTTVSVDSQYEAIDLADHERVAEAINTAHCIVTATGVPAALSEYSNELEACNALIANMGVEDEFGPDLDGSRVLNRKAPLNFLLTEPTELRFLDPTFALSNASATELVAHRVPPGIHSPTPELEDTILDNWNSVYPEFNVR